MRKRIFDAESTGSIGSRIVPAKRERCLIDPPGSLQVAGVGHERGLQGEQVATGMIERAGQQGRRNAAWISLLFWSLTLAISGCAAPTLKDQQTLIDADPRRQARFTDGAPQRVFLITVAGLQASDYLDPFGHAAAEGARVHMPTLARMAREGAMARVALPPSPGAPTATHATLVTGALPRRHGIVADSTLDREGLTALPFADSRMLTGTPLWDAALGRGVVSLGWPTTSGARIEHLLPELVGDNASLDRVRMGASPAVARALEEIAQAERAAIVEGGTGRDPATWPLPSEKDAAIVSVVCQIIESERDAGLWLIKLDQTASLLESRGPGTVEVDDALAQIDLEIETLIDCLSDAGQLGDSAIFVSGDAAYHPVHTTASPNVALARAGLIGRDPRSKSGVRSWLAISRTNGRSSFVYARDASNALDAREVLQSEADRTGAFSVVSANALVEAGGDRQAWFALVSPPGYRIGDALSGPPLKPSNERGAAGILRTDAASDGEAAVGFVAWGRGIRNAVQLPTVDLADVAPTIGALMGLRLGDDLEGEPILGILRASVEPPAAGPKRLGGDREVGDRLRDLRRGRGVGGDTNNTGKSR